MNLLENTADFVSSQLSSGSADPGVLQDVGASLLHGISNVMTAASTGAQQDEEEEEDSDESEDSEKETEKEKKKAAKGQVFRHKSCTASQTRWGYLSRSRLLAGYSKKMVFL